MLLCEPPTSIFSHRRVSFYVAIWTYIQHASLFVAKSNHTCMSNALWCCIHCVEKICDQATHSKDLLLAENLTQTVTFASTC